MFKFKELVAIWENELFISRERVYNKRDRSTFCGWISQFYFTIYFCLILKKTYKFTNIHILNVQMQCMHR